MYGNKSNAKWIALAALGVFVSSMAACGLLAVILSSAYGGQTVRLRTPFSRPTSPPAAVANPTSAANTGSTGNAVVPTSAPSNSGVTGVAGSAAAYLPNVSGYLATNTLSINGALEMLMGSANLSAQSAQTFEAQSLSAVAGSVLLSQVDEFTQCLQRSGAVDAQVYVQSDVSAILAGNVPAMGAIAVVNQERLRTAAASCALDSVGGGMFGAQSAQPCGDLGSFTIGATTYTYLYAATNQPFCDAVATYYDGLG